MYLSKLNIATVLVVVLAVILGLKYFFEYNVKVNELWDERKNLPNYNTIQDLQQTQRNLSSIAASAASIEDGSTPQQETIGVKSIKVLSVNHSAGRLGTYFNFNHTKLDELLGHTFWSNKKFIIQNMRTLKVGSAILWRSRGPAGPDEVGDGTAHGRWDDGSVGWVGETELAQHSDPKNDWNTGDLILILKEKISQIDSYT